MILLGHLSGSYLLSQVPALFNQPLPVTHQILIVGAGMIVDLDLLISKFVVKNTFNHHYSPTHTPIFALFLFIVFYLFFGREFSDITNVLIFTSLMMHFALDDISHWFTRLGLEKSSPGPQVYWLYPFDRRRLDHRVVHETSLISVLKNYYLHAPWTLSTEIILFIFALLHLIIFSL